MKRRRISDSIELPKEIIFSLIKVFTKHFGTPKRLRYPKREGYIQSFRYIFTWNLSKHNMPGYSNPPGITMYIHNNVTYSPTSKSQRNNSLFRKKSRIHFYGYTGNEHNKYSEIMKTV